MVLAKPVGPDSITPPPVDIHREGQQNFMSLWATLSKGNPFTVPTTSMAADCRHLKNQSERTIKILRLNQREESNTPVHSVVLEVYCSGASVLAPRMVPSEKRTVPSSQSVVEKRMVGWRETVR